MKSSIAAAVLGLFAAAAASALAVPVEARAEDNDTVAAVPAEAVGIDKRAITHVYICINENFQPACQNLEVSTGTCYNLINGYNDAVSSLGPDAGTTCTLWDDYGCSGGSLPGIINPGIYNLADYGWNDRASAIRCQ